MSKLVALVAAVVFSIALTACGTAGDYSSNRATTQTTTDNSTSTSESSNNDADGPVEGVIVEVKQLSERPTSAPTNGFDVFDDWLIESNGTIGASVRQLRQPTDDEVAVEATLPDDWSARDVTKMNDRGLQLTARSGVVIVFDPATLSEIDRYTFQGEGWGVCFDGTALLSSDGKSALDVRSPRYELVDSLAVFEPSGAPVTGLNTLTCTNRWVWATIWSRNEVLQIDRSTGVVAARFDLASVVPEGAGTSGYLSAIALAPGAAEAGTHRFYMTGHQWGAVYEVTLQTDLKSG